MPTDKPSGTDTPTSRLPDRPPPDDPSPEDDAPVTETPMATGTGVDDSGFDDSAAAEPMRVEAEPSPEDEAPAESQDHSSVATTDVPESVDRELRPEDVNEKTRSEIRALAESRGLEAFGNPDSQGNDRKWRDPDTKVQRLRIDEGHTDKKTGLPYDDQRAAVPHVHAYDEGGRKLVDPSTLNPHFPLRRDS